MIEDVRIDGRDAATADTPMSIDHPEARELRDTWRLAMRLAAGFETYVAQLRGTMGLSANEMNALRMLWDGGSCPMTELADRIAMSRPAMTSLVDRLEQDGWVQRLNDPRDRRQVLVALTSRFEHELVERTHAWRQRLQNHASASEGWRTIVAHAEAVGQLSRRSARELRDGTT